MEQDLTTTHPTPDPAVDPEIDELDVEAFAGLDCKPTAKRYLIRIDKKPHIVQKAICSGRELLTIAGKLPVERFRLWQVFLGGASEEISLNDTVDLRAKGVEKFRTLSRDQTEG